MAGLWVGVLLTEPHGTSMRQDNLVYPVGAFNPQMRLRVY